MAEFNPKDDKRFLVQGAFEEDDLDFISRVMDWKSEAKQIIDLWLTDELREHQFYVGNQWTAEEYEEFRESGREPLTLNRIQSNIDVVLGQERGNRTRVKFLPVDMGDDVEKADNLTEVVRVVQEQSGSDFEKSEAFADMFTTGRGFLEVRYDTIDDPDGQIVVEVIDPNELLYDPLAKKYDLSDARYFIRHKRVSLEEIYLQWPDKADQLDAMGIAVDDNAVSIENSEDYIPPYTYIIDAYSKEDKSWEVMEIWYWQVEKEIVAKNPESGEWETIKDNKSLDILNIYHENQGIPLESKTIYSKKFYHAFTCGAVLLEHEPSPHDYQGIPIIPFQGKLDKSTGRRYGAVKSLIDPQYESNKRRTQVLHILNRAAKSGWYGPRGSFANRSEWENESSIPGVILEYDIINGQKPEPIMPQSLPTTFLELEKLFVNDMRDISGINVEMMGLSVKDTPGIVTNQRIRQGMTILQVYMDNLKRSTKHFGRVLLAFIRQYYMNRVFKIIGKTGPQNIPISPEIFIGKYDLVVEEAPWSPNARQETMGLLLQVIPLALQAHIPIPPQVLDYLGLPKELADDWKSLLQPKPPMPPMGGMPAGLGKPGMPQPQPAVPQMPPQLPGGLT